MRREDECEFGGDYYKSADPEPGAATMTTRRVRTDAISVKKLRPARAVNARKRPGPALAVNLEIDPDVRGALRAVDDDDDQVVRELSPRKGDLTRLLQGAYEARVAVAVVPAAPPLALLSLVLKGGRRLTLDALGESDRVLLARLLPGNGQGAAGRLVGTLLRRASEARVQILIRCDLPAID